MFSVNYSTGLGKIPAKIRLMLILEDIATSCLTITERPKLILEHINNRGIKLIFREKQ